MAKYTSGGDKLHMAYTFDFLGGSFDTNHFRKSITETAAKAPEGWQCLAFSNHDVTRHISRWAVHGNEAEFARLACMLLLSMRGSVCIYQGEELGLTEADIAYEDLVDPYGIEFWPNYKGRDGCRTPMVWQSSAHLGAFTTAPRAWLPVPADHLVRAVDHQEQDDGSILKFYQAFIAFRKRHPALALGSIDLVDAPDGVLAFWRGVPGERLLCTFNMTNEELDFTIPDGLLPTNVNAPGTIELPEGRTLSLPPFGAYIGKLG
jgi:alpha-glucosidase